MEYYLFFGTKYNAITDPEEKTKFDEYIRTVLKFIAGRRRNWSLIYFHSSEGSMTQAVSLVLQSYISLTEEM